MKEFIKFEVIRNLKRKEIKILLIILVMCELIFLATLQKKSISEEIFVGSKYWVVTDAHFKSDSDLVAKDIEELQNGLELYHKYENEKQWRKMYWEAMKYTSYFGQVYAYEPYELTEKEKVFLQKVDILNEIQKKYGLPSIDKYAELIDTTTDLHSIFAWPLHELRYFTSLYENDLAPMTYSYVDSTTVFIQILRNILSLITPLLVGLLFFNDRKEYHDMGVDKSLMIIPKVRKKYILGKIIANTLIILIITLGPILLFTIIFGLFDHFGNLSYPLLANKKGLTEMYFPFIDGLYGPSTLQESIDNGIVSNFGLCLTSENMVFNPYMDFIPLWQGVLLGGGLFVLLTILYIQINMIITRLIRNPYLALTINIMVILFLIVCCPLTSMNILNVMNPLAYRDPLMNVIGTSYYPWIAGVVVVIIYNIILYFSNKFAFSYRCYD